MSNEISCIESGKFLAIAAGSEIADAVACNTAGETFELSDLVKVRTPAGGGAVWVVPGIMGNETAERLMGLMVGYHQRGTLWPRVELGRGKPLLTSPDLMHAYRVGEDWGDIDHDTLESHRYTPDELEKEGISPLLTVYRWADLPWTQWGSGKNGQGKRAKETRMVFILRPEEALPIRIDVPPGSLTSMRRFMLRLPVKHYRAVISLGLIQKKTRDDILYSEIETKLVGKLSAEEGEIIRVRYTEPIHAMCSKVHGNFEED